jgi:hypothetical protein
MFSITLVHGCAEERLKSPFAKTVIPTPERVFAIQEPPLLFNPLAWAVNPSSLHLDTQSIPIVSVDQTIEHIMCFVDRKALDESYPKYEACSLHGHSINQCHRLRN